MHTFEQGLSSERIRALSQLVAESLRINVISGVAPFVAPLLVMSLVATEHALPEQEEGHLLIQEHLALEHVSAITADRALHVDWRVTSPGKAAYRITAEIAHEKERVATIEARLLTIDAAAFARGSGVTINMNEKSISHRVETLAIEASVVARYVALAGDRNPLHVSRFMRSVGLPGAIVPGSFLAALIEPTLAFQTGLRLCRMNLRFTSPIFVNDRVTVAVGRPHLSAKPGDTKARIFILRSDGVLAAIADVTLS